MKFIQIDILNDNFAMDYCVDHSRKIIERYDFSKISDFSPISLLATSFRWSLEMNCSISINFWKIWKTFQNWKWSTYRRGGVMQSMLLSKRYLFSIDVNRGSESFVVISLQPSLEKIMTWFFRMVQQWYWCWCICIWWMIISAPHGYAYSTKQTSFINGMFFNGSAFWHLYWYQHICTWMISIRMIVKWSQPS